MVQISLQNSAGKVVFYGWVPRNPPPPFWHQREWKYLGHLSAKCTIFFLSKIHFFLTQISKRSTPTDLHHPDLHSAQFFSLESHKISSAYTKTSLGLKSVCATGYKKLSDDPNYINFCEVFVLFCFVFGVFFCFCCCCCFCFLFFVLFCFVCLFVCLFFFWQKASSIFDKAGDAILEEVSVVKTIAWCWTIN